MKRPKNRLNSSGAEIDPWTLANRKKNFIHAGRDYPSDTNFISAFGSRGPIMEHGYRVSIRLV
jgi:hypothetical protein